MRHAPATHRSGRTGRILSVLATTAILAGCSSTQTTSTQTGDQQAPASSAPATNPAQTGRLGVVTTSYGIDIVHDDWADLGYRWQWAAAPITAGDPRLTNLDVLGDVVAVQSRDSWTATIQASTGSTLWQVRNTGPLTQFVDNIRIGDALLSCGRPELFLMELGSGNLIARQPVDVVVSTPPVIYNGLAVFGTPTGEVLCHRFGTTSGDPLPPPFDDGAKAWGYLLDGGINAAPVRLGRTAGVDTQAGEVFFVDIPTGSGHGRARISGGMATDPVTNGTYMFVASLDQSIYAFAPGNSTYRWRYRTDAPLRSQPTYFDDALYVHIDSEGLVAFDVSEQADNAGRLGEVLWKNPDATGQVVAVRSDELVVWNGKTATLIDRVGGDTITAISLPKIDRLIPSTMQDGDLYAVSRGGAIIKFSPR